MHGEHLKIIDVENTVLIIKIDVNGQYLNLKPLFNYQQRFSIIYAFMLLIYVNTPILFLANFIYFVNHNKTELNEIN